MAKTTKLASRRGVLLVWLSLPENLVHSEEQRYSRWPLSLLSRDDAMCRRRSISSDDWAKNTIASWRHSIWVGVFDPWIVVRAGPGMWWKCLRDGICLERMHRAFDRGLMEYGMMRGTKKQIVAAVAAPTLAVEVAAESAESASL